MNSNNAKKLINTAWIKLSFLNDKSWTNHREELFRMCRDEEKSHRGSGVDFALHHTPDTWSIADCARLFAVRRIAEYLTGEKMPHGKDYLHCQKSCFYAAGLVDEYGAEIKTAWEGLPLVELATLNYTDFVKIREVVAA